MTRKELWHIRLGTRVQETNAFGDVSIGTVVKRQVENETCGFMIARNKRTGKIVEKDFYTGNKYLTVTIKFENGSFKYLDTLKPQYRLDCYQII